MDTCTLPANLAAGSYTVTITATDDLAHTSSAFTRSFTVDATPPTITISNPTAGSLHDAIPAFTFAVSDGAGSGPNSATFMCALNGGTPFACPASFTPTLADLPTDGGQTYAITAASDNVGNAATVPVTRSFTLDRAAPSLSVSGGPAEGTTVAGAVAAFSIMMSDVTNGSIGCTIAKDGGAATNISPFPQTYTAPGTTTYPCAPGTLTTGSYVVTITAVDAVGTMAHTSTHTRTFIVDATPPSFALTTPTSPSTNTTPTLTFTVTDTTTTTAQYKIDAGSLVACASTTSCTTTALAEGSHTITVRVTDALGLFTEHTTGSFIVDTANPIVAITTPPAFTDDTTPEFAYSVTDLSPTTVTCTLTPPSGPTIDIPCTSSSSPITSPTLAVMGMYSLTISASDSLGHGPTTDIKTFTLVAWLGTAQFGTASNEIANAVATDSSGNIYVAGQTAAALHSQAFAGGTYDVFVIKYGPTGTRVWTREFGTLGEDVALGIALDASGNIFVSGYTTGSLDGANAGLEDGFLLKLDTAGTLAWSRQIGNGTSDIIYNVGVDATGNAYLGGYTHGVLDGQPWGGSRDTIVVKYDTSGTKVWTREFGATGIDTVNRIAVEADGDSYIVGSTDTTLDAQPYLGGFRDALVIKYDTAGVRQWTRLIGTAANDGAFAVATDGSGNVFVSGPTTGDLDGHMNQGAEDVFVVKYDGGGTKIGTAYAVGSSGSDIALGMVVDGSGNLYVTGYTNGDLDGGSAGSNDLFLTKFNAAGLGQWTKQLGTLANDHAQGVALDADDQPVCTGGTEGDLDDNLSHGAGDGFIVKYDIDGVLL